MSCVIFIAHSFMTLSNAKSHCRYGFRMGFSFKAFLIFILGFGILSQAELSELGEKNSLVPMSSCHPLLTFGREWLGKMTEAQRRQMVLRHLFMTEAQFALGINRQRKELMDQIDSRIEAARKVIDVPWESEEMPVVSCPVCEADDESIFSDELIKKRVEYYPLPYKNMNFQVRFPSLLENEGRRLRRLHIDLKGTNLAPTDALPVALNFKHKLYPIKYNQPQKTYTILIEWESDADKEALAPLRQLLKLLSKQ